MDRLTENKLILVVRKTRLEELIAKYNTINQAKFYIEHLGGDFSDYVHEHETYHQAIKTAEAELRQQGRVQAIDRSFLPNFIFGPKDLVIAVGQDGLVANTLKYLNGHALIGVNPDPKRWDGILLPFTVNELARIVPEVFSGRRKIQDVTMAKAELNNGQFLYGVNDIFIGQKSHVSARYTIKLKEFQEQQSSSGIIVSTGLGSTGWLKSVYAGAHAIGNHKTMHHRLETSSPWDANYLNFTVREPFPSRTTSTTLVCGEINIQSPLSLTSHMSENGVIFSDGMEADCLEFNSGMVATLGIADKVGHLVL